METKTAVKLANIAGRIETIGYVVEASDVRNLLINASVEIKEAIKADLPYGLKEDDL